MYLVLATTIEGGKALIDLHRAPLIRPGTCSAYEGGERLPCTIVWFGETGNPSGLNAPVKETVEELLALPEVKFGVAPPKSTKAARSIKRTPSKGHAAQRKRSRK